MFAHQILIQVPVKGPPDFLGHEPTAAAHARHIAHLTGPHLERKQQKTNSMHRPKPLITTFHTSSMSDLSPDGAVLNEGQRMIDLGRWIG